MITRLIIKTLESILSLLVTVQEYVAKAYEETGERINKWKEISEDLDVIVDLVRKLIDKVLA